MASVPSLPKILRPTDGAHWSVPDHVFGKATAVRKNEAKSDQAYNYKSILKFGKRTRNLSAKSF